MVQTFAKSTFGMAVAVCLIAPPLSGLLSAKLFAQEVVQRLPDPAAQELTQALQRLSRNPSSVPALVRAGRASLRLNDVDAALGFFSRAQAVAPNNGSVLAGLALIALRRGDAVTALEFFADADAAGHSLSPYAAERGLAFDLVGRNSDAQRLYRQSLERNANAAVTRRLALSYAISGDATRSERTLLPLLQRGDNTAYRTRAFALAILGRGEEASSIAETMLPARLSSRLEPYLRYMPRLTRAQQAAAANLGRFPAAAQIGQDTPQIAQAAAGDQRLVPQGEPLGSAPTIAQAKPLSLLPEPITLPPEPEETVSLAEAFSDFTLPGDSNAAIAPRTGAVDITAIEPASESAAPLAQPPTPEHPSRHWVQVATGQNAAAFRFDWRRLVRLSDGLLDGRDAYHANWGQTNRLVTGPFATTREAQQFVTQLGQADIGAFRWTSESGQEVAKIQ